MDEVLCRTVFLRSFNVLVCVDSINFFIVQACVTSCVEYCIISTVHGCISINIILSYLILYLSSQAYIYVYTPSIEQKCIIGSPCTTCMLLLQRKPNAYFIIKALPVFINNNIVHQYLWTQAGAASGDMSGKMRRHATKVRGYDVIMFPYTVCI